MNRHKFSVCLGLAALASTTLSLAETNAVTANPEVSIPFANHGGIRNWRADGSKGLWIQSSRGSWYYASFMGPCTGLNFANGLGFDTRPMGSFDRFSSVVVPRDGTCQVKSLIASDGPPSKRMKTAVPPAAPQDATAASAEPQADG